LAAFFSGDTPWVTIGGFLLIRLTIFRSGDSASIRKSALAGL
jgi:hypothetical protein